MDDWKLKHMDRKLERAVWAVVREHPYLNRVELTPLIHQAWRDRGLGEPGQDIPLSPRRILDRLANRGELIALAPQPDASPRERSEGSRFIVPHP